MYVSILFCCGILFGGASCCCLFSFSTIYTKLAQLLFSLINFHLKETTALNETGGDNKITKTNKSKKTKIKKLKNIQKSPFFLQKGKKIELKRQTQSCHTCLLVGTTQREIRDGALWSVPFLSQAERRQRKKDHFGFNSFIFYIFIYFVLGRTKGVNNEKFLSRQILLLISKQYLCLQWHWR